MVSSCRLRRCRGCEVVLRSIVVVLLREPKLSYHVHRAAFSALSITDETITADPFKTSQLCVRLADGRLQEFDIILYRKST